MATFEELQEKYDVSAPLISSLVGNDFLKTRSYLLSMPHLKRKWSTAATTTDEMRVLLGIIGWLSKAYVLTNHDKYKKYGIYTARKLVAAAFEILLRMEGLPPSPTIRSPEANEYTEIADECVKLIKKCLATGNPHISPEHFM
jgi:hypothetical protein